MLVKYVKKCYTYYSEDSDLSMANKGFTTDFFEQLQQAFKKIDSLSLELQNVKDELKEVKKDNEILIVKLSEANLEIDRLKNQINKDSSNSSKPTSTNNFKKITNNREKSSNKKGAVLGHIGKTFTPKYIEKLISDNEVDEVITVEVNKNQTNKNLKPIVRYTYDIEVKRTVTKTLYYPDNIGNYNLPDGKIVSYGNNIKTLSSLLSNNYMSYDGIKEMFKFITNNTINLSKATILSWNELLSKNLNPEMENIKTKLLNSLVLNVDESPFKIDGEQYYIHTVSNGFYTLQYKTKHRSKDDIDAFGFLKQYKGIIVHDHYILYYNYGSDNAECNVHILRYLNGVTEFTNHNWAKELKELLLEMKARKEDLINDKKDSISEDDFEDFQKRYLKILVNGKKERLTDIKRNAYRNDELLLLNRLIKYEHNHLLFLENFIVPFSNNRAEADLRKIKIKQKIGKFRSEKGADTYAIIRSCASTYSKNNINLFNAFKSAFNNVPVII